MTFNNKAITFGSTPKWLSLNSVDPYNPLDLPPYTMRFQFSDTSYDPTTESWTDCSWQRVSSSPNVWDYTKTDNVTNWGQAFRFKFSTSLPNRVTVLGANTTGVTNFAGAFTSVNLMSVSVFDTRSVTSMSYTFAYCNSYLLTSMPLLDTSSVTDMSGMFLNCLGLTSIPLLDTSSVADVRYMCSGCRNVESGSLALYQQMSSQATPPSLYADCFADCGADTVSGQAELDQIPTDWGGTNYEEKLG